MSVNLDGRVIRGIDINNQAFRQAWKGLPGNVQDEAIKTISSLAGKSLDLLPAKLHYHPLMGKEVPSRLVPDKKVKAWSLHITADDRYKASFTYEDGVLYFRTCGLYDTIDKKP